MNKPITLIREETKQDLINIINQCGLPAFVIEPIVQNILTEVKTAVKREYEYDRQRYESYLESECEMSSEDMGDEAIEEITEE